MASATSSLSSSLARIGRFELRKVLGKGAQATVWLGFDPRLEREVAVKLMRSDAGDAQVANDWLQEARNVSRLKHPHIVQVYEADTHERQPYLVFEYVAGATLSEHLKRRGALPTKEAVPLMLGVLDALQAAHVLGVVHRDLKPSNILVDASGQARVMDFGIAARVQQHDSANQRATLSGTPAYMSPEAADGAAPAPSMDVFSAGLVLAELLSGQPLVAEKDAFRALYRIAHEDLSLPSTLGSEVDDSLRAIVQRGIARDVQQRYPSAAAFRDALQGWLMPQPISTETSAADASKGNNGTLEFLLRRMRHKSDFPAMSDSVARIQRVANSENESLGSLSAEILQDVALTNKLLRMVNTAHYSHAGGGNISTVSRAVALVGFAGIRNMAMSLVLLEHMQDKSHVAVLKEEFLRSLMAGSLATELCPVAKEGEEAFIAAMFQNLGRLLTEYYFPEEARQVRNMVATHKGPNAEEAASVSVLGLSYEDLGLGVAKTWGLPENLQKSMRKPMGEPPSQTPSSSIERQRWLAAASNDISDAMIRTDGPLRTKAVEDLAKRYANALGLKTKDIEAAAAQAQQKLSSTAKAMGLQLQKNSPANSLLATSPSMVGLSAQDSLTPHALQATVVAVPRTSTEIDHLAVASDTVNRLGGAAPADVLAAGIQDITNSMVENFKLNEVLRMILETMFRALEFRRIVFCLRDPKTNMLTGRFGLGDEAAKVTAAFKISLQPANDLFTAICLKGMDTMISDASSNNVATRLPVWYRQSVNAPCFLMLPLQLKGATFALIYADKAHAGEMSLGEKELSLLRTLRNQGVMAFKQAT